MYSVVIWLLVNEEPCGLWHYSEMTFMTFTHINEQGVKDDIGLELNKNVLNMINFVRAGDE